MLMSCQLSQTLPFILTSNCTDCKMPATFPSPVAVHTCNISTVSASATPIGATTAPKCTLDRQSEQSVGLEVLVYSFKPRIICIPLIVLANGPQQHNTTHVVCHYKLQPPARQRLYSDMPSTSIHVTAASNGSCP
jgi:hypothetical protein